MSQFPHRILIALMRKFFRLLYHQFAWGYDMVSRIVSAGRWQTWVLSVLPDVTGPVVLEIGHGPGHLLVGMRKSGLGVVGLDESWQMSGLAFSRLVGFGGCCLLVNGYAQFLPFRSHSFNTIVSTFPSEYILDPRSLSEAFRVLAPGGTMVILPIAWITGKSWYDHLAAWIFRFTGQTGDWEKLYTQYLISSGFSVRVEYRESASSRLLIVHASKPKSSVV